MSARRFDIRTAGGAELRKRHTEGEAAHSDRLLLGDAIRAWAHQLPSQSLFIRSRLNSFAHLLSRRGYRNLIAFFRLLHL